ncbi:MAG: response regulator [Nitrospirae bacterium]|nr:response regulator [Nitrospirota bacterium]
MAQILVIEDDEQIRGLIREVLEESGHEVLESSDGEDGLKKFSLNPTYLVITDILMPGMEGLETIRHLRTEVPTAKIIAISGGLEGKGVNVLELAKKFGATRILAKPFDLSQLLAAVEEVLVD